MLGHELAVEQGEVTNLEAGNQPGQSHLRSIAHSGEHALSEKGAAETHAVEAADEFTGVPDFDGIGMAASVKREHCMLDLRVDPCLFPRRAASDDRSEITVAGDAEPLRAQGSAERPREVELVERKDCASAGLDPEQLGGVAAVGHREDAAGVALEQKTRIEATHARHYRG
jgi:hypothetical protein